MRLILTALALGAIATPVLAQAPNPHAGHQMPAKPAPAPAKRPAAKPPAAKPAAAKPAPARRPAAKPAPRPAAARPAAPRPAAVDPHAGHTMPAPAAPASQVVAPADPHAGHQMAIPAAANPHAGHTMAPVTGAPVDPHAGHQMPMSAAAPSAAQLPVGSAPPPPVVIDNAAERFFGAAPMQRARAVLAEEHGDARVSKVMADILEYTSKPDGGGYRWDVEGWYGGDINRFVVKSEGEGSSRDGVEHAEVQALYSRAVGTYTDVQAGLRYDFQPDGRAYATVGVETLLPYWFEVEAAAFLSDRGDLLGRVEGSYDLRLTQRLILQPRAELEFAAQDIPDIGIGSGLSEAELGLRLRYEIRREFAPYVGVTYSRSFGGTADFARTAGEDVGNTSFVVGIRTWF